MLVATKNSFEQELEELSAQVPLKNRAGLDTLRQIGLPHPKSMDFSYIDTRLLTPFWKVPALAPQPHPTILQTHQRLLPQTNSWQILFFNGEYSKSLSNIPDNFLRVTSPQKLPDNIIPFKNNSSNRQIPGSDFFSSLNSLYAKPTVIEIMPDVKIDKPIQVIEICQNPETAAHHRIDRRVILHAGKNSRSHFVFFSAAEHNDIPFMSNSHWDVFLEENAQCEGVFYSEFSDSQLELSRWQFDLQSKAEFVGHHFTRGSRLTRQSLVANLSGTEARFVWNSTAVLDESRQAHAHLVINHLVPNTHSEQTIKNILKGNSRSSVDGTVFVHPGAQLSNSRQIINNLVLSDNARAGTKPNLLIFADDVKCNHGATLGHLNPDQLFYLQSRGLSKEHSLAILIESYLNSNVEKISDPAIRSQMSLKLKDKL